MVAPHEMRQFNKPGLRGAGFVRNDRRSDQLSFRCVVSLLRNLPLFTTDFFYTIVFIIRKAERRIDELLNAALLEHTPLLSEFDSVKFESDWSIFRPFSAKKKPP